MYGFFQTAQAPLQFVWCSAGLQNNGIPPLVLWNSISTTPIYISVSGASPSVYTNQRGTLSYTFTKSGKTTGTSTGTATSSTSFTDSTNTATGTSNYNLTIKDANTGQQNIYTSQMNWGLL
uniref:Uncharacterized protein n=1 Tax=viral metagenome TaxID=1070528 RepID=A0A6C0EEB8_9ZZZZ